MMHPLPDLTRPCAIPVPPRQPMRLRGGPRPPDWSWRVPRAVDALWASELAEQACAHVARGIALAVPAVAPAVERVLGGPRYPDYVTLAEVEELGELAGLAILAAMRAKGTDPSKSGYLQHSTPPVGGGYGWELAQTVLRVRDLLGVDVLGV